MPALFALDQNFPEPIVQALNEYLPDVELVPLREIDPLLTSDMDDWQVLLALHHHERPWDGLITNDSGILNLPPELAVLRQTNLTLVIAEDVGHDPIRATGLLFTHLSYIARETTPERSQVWRLVARNRPGADPWEFLERIADHRNESVESVWEEARLSRSQLAVIRSRSEPPPHVGSEPPTPPWGGGPVKAGKAFRESGEEPRRATPKAVGIGGGIVSFPREKPAVRFAGRGGVHHVGRRNPR